MPSYAHDMCFMSACFPCAFEDPGMAFGKLRKLASGESTCGRKDGNVHGACTSVDPVGRFERAALDCHIGQMLFDP